MPSSPFRFALCGVLLLASSLVLSGCSDESLLAPEATNDAFARYVALGGSITAGFQSLGITASIQDSSYAALLAGQMDTRFELPRLAPPGCPPPVENIAVANLTGRAGTGCNLRSAPTPTTLNNVAVPSARVVDALTNNPEASASPNVLTTLILGGRTQVEAARAVEPTFATVWLGNNDALVAALSGDTETLTAADAFKARITRVIDTLVAAGAHRGVLVGVADPTFVPHLSSGQAYARAESRINDLGEQLVGPQWGGFEVTGSCASGGGALTRVPFAYGFGTLFRRALTGQAVDLVCDPSAAPPPLLTPAEQNTVSARVQAFNSTISSLAAENGWVYVNPNPSLQALYRATDDQGNDLVPKFPNPPTNFIIPEDNPPTFGRYFSEDGIHPSSTTHRVMTHLIIRELNSQYDDIQLDQVSIPDEIESLLQ